MADEGEACPEYKVLKKRMKAGFKEIRKAVKKGGQIEGQAVLDFCADAYLMMAYPDKGDEYYPLFRKQVEKLSEATAQGDALRVAEAVAELKRMEKECHKRFK